MHDLNKTWYLKTSIIEKEWYISLKIDIFDGPKNPKSNEKDNVVDADFEDVKEEDKEKSA